MPGNPEDQHIEMGCSRDTTTVEIAGFGSSPESGNTEVDVVSTNGSGQSHTMVSGDEVDGVGGVANFAGQVEQPPVTTQGPTGDDDVPAGPNPVSDGSKSSYSPTSTRLGSLAGVCRRPVSTRSTAPGSSAARGSSTLSSRVAVPTGPRRGEAR